MKYSCAKKGCMDETHQEVVHVLFFKIVLFFLDFTFAPPICFFFPGEFASQKPPRATQWLSQHSSNPLRIHRWCGTNATSADHVSNTDVTNGFGRLESTSTSASKVQLQGFRLRCGFEQRSLSQLKGGTGGWKKVGGFYFCVCLYFFGGWGIWKKTCEVRLS